MDESIIEYIAEMTVKKILEHQKKAVVVFTGSNINFDQALDSVKSLLDDGFTFKVIISNNACKILDEKKIIDALRPEVVWRGAADTTPEALTKMYDTFIVPTMTVNTTAHVVNCMADNPTSAIILDGLMRGKNVIVNIDGCCPDNPERPKRGFNFTPALRDRLHDNLEILRSYGARLATSTTIAEKVRKALGLSFKTSDGEAAQKARPNVVSTSSHVVSVKDLFGCVSGGTLKVEKGALITQLAKEEAARRGITISIS